MISETELLLFVSRLGADVSNIGAAPAEIRIRPTRVRGGPVATVRTLAIPPAETVDKISEDSRLRQEHGTDRERTALPDIPRRIDVGVHLVTAPQAAENAALAVAAIDVATARM
jgi:hypothetical protein